MDWVILLASGVMEAVWATALGRSNGLRKPLPTAIFVVASILSLCSTSMASTPPDLAKPAPGCLSRATCAWATVPSN